MTFRTMQRRQGNIRETNLHTGVDRRITEEELDKRGAVAHLTDEGRFTKLWDTVDEEWTTPFSTKNIQYYLSKKVFRCSACRETSVTSNRIEGHIRKTMESGIDHMAVSVIAGVAPDGKTNVSICAGCGYSNVLHPIVQRHIDERIQAIEPHKEAQELSINRFSREPLAPSSPVAARIALLPQDRGGPVALLENGAAPRSRGRRRRHNRGRRHGIGNQT